MFEIRRRRRFLLVLLVLLVLFAAGCSGDEDRPDVIQARRYNVVLVSIDTLRADRMSLYGHDRPTTPGLDAMAEESIVFENHFNNGGGTLPSHVSMMTSLNVRTHWVTPHTERVLEEERTTLAEVLRDAGYRTAGFVDDGWMRAKFGFGQGFEVYDDVGGRLAALEPKLYSWLEEHYREPFFLFLQTYDVHSEWRRLPYECPGDGQNRYLDDADGGFDGGFDGCRDEKCASALFADLNTRIRQGEVDPATLFTKEELDDVRALYDGCINYVDERIALLMDRLRQLGVYDESLIVITSDHGEEFLEHGLLLHDQIGYDEFAHIPLLVRLPRATAGGRRVAHLSTLVDVLPTVLDVLGLPAPRQAQGVSLLPAMLRGEPTRRDIHMLWVLRTERWKYFAKEKKLYDLENDPNETVNLIDRPPVELAELDRRLWKLYESDERLFEEFSRKVAAGEPFELTAEEVEELKSLGYLR